MFQINTISETMPYTIMNRKGRPVASIPNPEFEPSNVTVEADTIPIANTINAMINKPTGIKCDNKDRFA